MKDEEVLRIAGETLDQGLCFSRTARITRATDAEILRFAFKLEMTVRKRLSDWLINNYQEAGSISNICDHIMDQTK